MMYRAYIFQFPKKILLMKNSKFWILILILTLISCGTQQDNPADASALNPSVSDLGEEQTPIEADQADVSSMDAIIGALYDSISFPDGRKPNMDRLRSLFTPRAPFIRIMQDGVDRMDLESFTASFQERIDTGALKSFYETEIFRKTHAFGNMAQVFSSYKKRMNSEDPEVYTRGINSIQLYYDGQRWWMGSILWEDERSDNPIPEDYLKGSK
jgi:hypothetical protein